MKRLNWIYLYRDSFSGRWDGHFEEVEVGQRLSANFAIPILFLIAEDLTQMQVDAAVSESDIGGMSIGKEATFTVDAYPGSNSKDGCAKFEMRRSAFKMW